MDQKKINIRQILPNPIWLELSRLRPAWGPWPGTVWATAAFVEHLLTPMENLPSSVRCDSSSKFFASFARVVSSMPGIGCVGEMWTEFLLLELIVVDQSFDFLVGIRRTETGEWFLTASGDWCAEAGE